MNRGCWCLWALLVVGPNLGCKKSAPPSEEPPKPAAVEERPPATPPAEAAGPAQTLSGEVLFTGKAPAPTPLKRTADPFCAKTEMLDETVKVEDGKLANVVVRVVDAPAGAVPTEPVVVDQRDCMYRPRVQGAVKGQPLVVNNSDKTLHNVHTYDGTKTVFNRAQPGLGAPVREKVDAKGVLKFRCDVHPWMTGYVVYADNPFFATTGDDGKFEIKNLPPGTYTVEAWHEKLGTRSTKVTVGSEAGEPLTLRY